MPTKTESKTQDQMWLDAAMTFNVTIAGHRFVISRYVYGGHLIPDGKWSACTYYSSSNPHYACWNGDTKEWVLVYKVYTPVDTYQQAYAAAKRAQATMDAKD